jgi:large subunit ribosomal protein L4
MSTYTISSVSTTDTKGQALSFDSVSVSDNLSGNVHLILTTQKNDRFVYANTMNRRDFDSGGAKPYKQKGTGRARQGTSRSPLKVGGAVVFGPKPRRVKRKSNKTFFLSTLKQLLLSKVSESVVLVKDEAIKKAADFSPLVSNKKSYLVIMDVFNSDDVTLFLTIKNLPNLYFNNVHSLNIEDVLRADSIVYTPSAFDGLFKDRGDQ